MNISRIVKSLTRAAMTAAVIFFASLSAHAEWLYWAVNFNNLGASECPWKDTDGTPYAWMVAYKEVQNEDGTVTVTRQTLSGVDDEGNAVTYAELTKSTSPITGQPLELAMTVAIDQLGTLEDLASYSFFVEMGNYLDGQEYAKYESVRLSYGDLKKAGYINLSPTFSDQGFWNPALSGSFSRVVPEPTSGMLFGLGLCVLALRRKRKRGAA